MTFLQLQNKSGKYVSPDDLTFADIDRKIFNYVLSQKK